MCTVCMWLIRLPLCTLLLGVEFFFIAQALVEHRRRLMTDFNEYRRRVEEDMAEASEAYRREFRSKASQGAVATGVN